MSIVFNNKDLTKDQTTAIMNLGYDEKSKKAIDCNIITETKTFVPFHWALKNMNVTLPELTFRTLYECKHECVCPFGSGCTKVLRRYQLPLIETAVNYLKEFRCFTFTCDPGAGKTLMSLFIASLLDEKCVIIGPRGDYPKQWANELISRNPRASIYCETSEPVKAKNRNPYVIKNCKFIMCFCNRIGVLHALDPTIFDNVGLLIVDETHQACAQTVIDAILLINPKYAIACTGTPDTRPSYVLMNYIFGQKQISYSLNRKFTMVRYATNIILNDVFYANSSVEDREKLIRYGNLEKSVVLDEIATFRILLLLPACFLRCRGKKQQKYFNLALSYSQLF